MALVMTLVCVNISIVSVMRLPIWLGVAISRYFYIIDKAFVLHYKYN